MRSFYWRWLKTSFRHSLGPIDLWTGLAASILGVAAHFLPDGEAAITALAWQVPLWALGLVMLVRLILAPYWMWKEDQASRAIDSPAWVFPDWLIRDLFYALEPNVLDEPNWLAVGQVVRDNLALGRLKCWGRPINDDWIAKMVSPRQPAPIEVPHTYWQHADFSYQFFSEDFGEWAPHTHPDDMYSGIPSYTDLMFNKAEALSQDWSAIERFKREFAQARSDKDG